MVPSLWQKESPQFFEPDEKKEGEGFSICKN
jgi:hypothetical protein